MTDELKSDLAALAERVTPIDLTAAAHRTARRARIRDAMVAGVAGIAVLATGIMWTTASPQAGDQGAAEDAAADAPMSGRFFFLADTDDGMQFGWWTADGEVETVLAGGGELLYSTVRVAPDGGHFSYVTEDGELRVQDLDSGKHTALDSYSTDVDMCTAPAWAPDSQRLFVQRDTDEFGFFDITDGSFTESVAPAGCDAAVAVAPDGSDRLISIAVEGDGPQSRLMVTDSDGTSEVSPLMDLLQQHEGRDGYPSDIVAMDSTGSQLCLTMFGAKPRKGGDELPDEVQDLKQQSHDQPARYCDGFVSQTDDSARYDGLVRAVVLPTGPNHSVITAGDQGIELDNYRGHKVGGVDRPDSLPPKALLIGYAP
jgi:hypothetical protein